MDKQNNRSYGFRIAVASVVGGIIAKTQPNPDKESGQIINIEELINVLATYKPHIIVVLAVVATIALLRAFVYLKRGKDEMDTAYMQYGYFCSMSSVFTGIILLCVSIFI